MNAYQHDNGEPVLSLFASYADDGCTLNESIIPPFPDAQDLSTWSSADLLDHSTYDAVSQYSLTALAPDFSAENHYYRKPLPNKSFQDEFSEKPLSWDHGNNLHYDYRHLSNPTAQYTSQCSVASSPSTYWSESSASPSPPLNEFANMFDFNFAPLPSDVGHPICAKKRPSRSPRSKSIPTHSPSLSCSSLDASETRSNDSRDSSPSNLENDLQRRRFPCLIIGCSRRFTSQYTLKVHMEAHKPKPRVSFPCTLGCSERFSRQHDRLRHEVAKHGKICEFLCDECGRFFSSKKTLGNHKCPVAQGGTRWVDS